MTEPTPDELNFAQAQRDADTVVPTYFRRSADLMFHEGWFTLQTNGMKCEVSVAVGHAKVLLWVKRAGRKTERFEMDMGGTVIAFLETQYGYPNAH